MVRGVELESAERESDGFVGFLGSGEAATGDYHCSECGYGVTVRRELPICPMCGGDTWEQTPRSPLTRALAAQLND